MSGVRSFDYYVNRFMEGVSYTKNIDYGDRRSVSKNNQGVDMYRKAAKSIGKYYPEKTDMFARILDSADKDERETCAYCIIEFMNPDKQTREHCLRIIKEKAMYGDSVDRTLVKYWLTQHAPEELGDDAQE